MADIADNTPPGLDEFIGAQPQAAPATPQLAAGPTQQEAPTDDGAPAGLDEFIAPEAAQAKYGTTGQQVIAGLEGLAKGAAGPVATGLERLVGVPAEDIRGRAEANPVTHYGAEGAGLVGTALATMGLGSALAKTGEAVGVGAEALGLGKVGSAIAKGAVENLVYQAGDEASKMILKDPNQSAETAVADLGLAAAIGGGVGLISPLWHATMGNKTAGVLGALANKMGGIEGVVPDALQGTISKTGMELAPEIRAGLAKDPQIQEMFKTLEQSDTTAAGKELQKSYNTFRNDAGHAIISAFGKTPEEVGGDVSKYAMGKAAGDSLAEEYKAQVSPLAESFDNFKSKFKSVELPQELTLDNGVKVPSTVDGAIDKISKLAIDEGWAASPSSDIMKEVNRVTKELPLQKNLKNLSDYITQIGANTQADPLNGPLRRAGALMKNVLKDAEADVITAKLGEKEGPAAVEAFKQVRKDYAAQSQLKEALDSRLHIGGSTSGYAKLINEMAKTDGETLLRRLSGVGDADAISFLQKNYPKTAEIVKNYHIDDLLKHGADKAKPGMTINSEALLSKFNKMQPELKNFIAGPEAQGKITAVESLISEFNKLPHNFSNTGRTVDKLLQYIPGTVVGAAAMIHGSNPVTGALMGYLTKAISKDIPDAMRLGILKFLGSDKQINSKGFKAMVEYMNHTIKGENLLSKGVKSVFRAGSEVIPASQMPTEKDRNQIKKAITSMRNDPSKMLNVSGDVGHYMPDHSTAITQTAANAIKFLDSQRPDTDPKSPLDTKREPSSYEKAQYDRKLDIAQQPLMILKHIAEGTLTPEDVNVQKTLYPALYQRTVQKLTDELSKTVSKGLSVPYKTRMGLSLYTGQALDSTMTPAGIMAAQPKPQQAQPQTPTQPASNPKRSTASLNKIPGMYRTSTQSAEQDRAGRKTH